MDEYKPNSHKSRDKKIGKVVTGEVVTRKKSGVRKFADALIAEGVDDIRSYIIREIIAPKAKDMISSTIRHIADGISEGVDKLLYGENSRNDNSDSRPYASYYNGARKARTVTYRDSGFRSDEFEFRSRGDAEMVLRDLKENLSMYHVVSVADFYSLTVGDEYATATDNNYGWTDLRDAKIRQVRGGYILDLPKLVYLDD